MDNLINSEFRLVLNLIKSLFNKGQLVGMHILGFDGTNHRFLICLWWERAQVAGCVHLNLTIFVYDAARNLSLELFCVGVISFWFGVLLQLSVGSNSDIFNLMLQRPAAHPLHWSFNASRRLFDSQILKNYGIEPEWFLVKTIGTLR